MKTSIIQAAVLLSFLTLLLYCTNYQDFVATFPEKYHDMLWNIRTVIPLMFPLLIAKVSLDSLEGRPSKQKLTVLVPIRITQTEMIPLLLDQSDARIYVFLASHGKKKITKAGEEIRYKGDFIYANGNFFIYDNVYKPKALVVKGRVA
jgi:hypothetical protein